MRRKAGKGLNFSEYVGKVIFEKYRIEVCLCRGAFGEIYICENTQDGKRYAMKVPFVSKYGEDGDRQWKHLAEFTFQREAFILQQFLKYETKWSLRKNGFPIIHDLLTLEMKREKSSPTKEKDTHEQESEIDNINKKLEYSDVEVSNTLSILVMDLLGPSLSDIFWYLKKTDSTKTPFSEIEVYCIGIQIIESLQFLHSHGLVHCDLKPSNILVGGSLWRRLYLVDFGMSENYISREGRHVEFGKGKGFLGTALYSGKSALMGNMPSRKDDMESLGFVLYYLLTGELGWMKLCELMRDVKSVEEKEKLRVDVFKMKYKFFDFLEKVHRLETSDSKERNRRRRKYEFDPFVRYFKMVKNLGYDEQPNYGRLKGIFEKFVLEKSGNDEKKAKMQKFNFSWSKNSNHQCFKKFKSHGRSRELDSSSVLFGEQIEMRQSIPFFVV